MDKETFELIEESFPEEIRTIRMLLGSGESIEEVEQWANSWFSHKFHSGVTGNLFVQAIHYLAGE